MRVLHVNDYAPGHGRGGAEVYLDRLMSAQLESGTDVDVLTSVAERSGVARALDLWDPASARRLRAAVRATSPDVVHVHSFVRELSPSVLLHAGVPTVLTVHDMRLLGGSEHRLPSAPAVAGRLWVEPVSRALARRAAAVTGVSDVLSAALRAAGMRRVSTLPVPVPAPLVSPRPVRDCHDIVFAGRLSLDKGARVLVAAFRQLAGQHPGTRLLLAGDGPDHRALLDQAGDGVVLLGRLDAHGVSEQLGRARVVVVPSLPALRREGSSMTAVEAARHGRPLVTSDDPAVAEITRRAGGTVVPAGDAGALATELARLLSDPDGAEAEGAAAARGVVAHEPSLVAAEAERVYRAAIVEVRSATSR